jgi:hypothetical protein
LFFFVLFFRIIKKKQEKLKLTKKKKKRLNHISLTINHHHHHHHHQRHKAVQWRSSPEPKSTWSNGGKFRSKGKGLRHKEEAADATSLSSTTEEDESQSL